MTSDYLDKQIGRGARVYFNRFKDDPGVCGWCFHRNYQTDIDEAEREAYYLLARNRSAFEARGHRIGPDGTVEANKGARMSREPETSLEWVPPETDEMGRQTAAPRKKSICEGCGTIERKKGMDRDNELLQRSAKHLIENFKELTGIDEGLDEEAALEWVESSKSNPELQGQDEYVLTRAIYHAIEPLFSSPTPVDR